MPLPDQQPAYTPPAYDSRNPFAGATGGLRAQPALPGGAQMNRTPPGGPPVNADQLLSDITRAQFADYQARYRPLEMANAKFLTSDDWIGAGVARADTRVQKAYANSAETTARETERYGLDLAPGQAATMKRMRALGLSTSRGVARNNTRAALDDVRTQGLNAMAGYGRGLADQSQSLATGVANRAMQVDAANDQMDAQEDAQRTQTIASLGMMAIMFMSSRDYKHNIVSVDAEVLADELRHMRVVEYDYKPDLPVQGHYVGLIAEETPARYRSDDGKQVNLYSLIGALISANQQLMRRVESLEELSDGR